MPLTRKEQSDIASTIMAMQQSAGQGFQQGQETAMSLAEYLGEDDAEFLDLESSQEIVGATPGLEIQGFEPDTGYVIGQEKDPTARRTTVIDPETGEPYPGLERVPGTVKFGPGKEKGEPITIDDLDTLIKTEEASMNEIKKRFPSVVKNLDEILRKDAKGEYRDKFAGGAFRISTEERKAAEKYREHLKEKQKLVEKGRELVGSEKPLQIQSAPTTDWRENLPEGIIEEDVLYTAEQEGITPEEVLQRLGR